MFELAFITFGYRSLSLFIWYIDLSGF
jgi:hypothetical protein